MSTLFNYIIEANLGLLFCITIYWLFLRNENQFFFNRMFLLSGLVLSLVLPLLHFNTPGSVNVIPSLNEAIPTYWIPGNTAQPEIAPVQHDGISPVTILFWVYSTGVVVLSSFFALRILTIALLIIRAKKYRWNQCVISESNENKHTWSFFNFIFIGQALKLTSDERERILNHEIVHVQKLHSLDVLTLNIVSIVFWFNPLVIFYKKALVQIHEFEADARSVKNQDVDTYCVLLAKIALQNAGYSPVNYFNNSLTLKRITMMKTLKRRIQPWKLTAIAITLPLLIFAVSCQDQVMSDVKSVGQNSATAVLIPKDIAIKLDALQKLNPQKEWIVVELNDAGQKTLEKLKLDNVITGDLYERMEVNTTDKNSEGAGRTFVFLEKNKALSKLSDFTAADDVFSFVDEQPEFPGGFDSLRAYISRHVSYPEDARKRGVEGKVLVSFVVDEKGTVILPEVIKGIDAQCDKQALSVVAGFPKWIPGKNQGINVKVKFVVPINFSLGS